jgi:membrane dipeptidase
LEGLEPLVNDLDLLYIFHELGVRIAGLTWNRLTPFVSPFFEESGVFSRGWDLFKTINELHLITDFSHSSEKTFFQATEKLTCPIIASHSNCYTLNPVKRNLKDDQIKLIQERKGVIGINFAPIFLETDSKLSSFELIYNQIDYLASKFSSDIIAFGSDFDGLDEYLSGIENPSFFQDFGAYLVTRGVSSEDINKIFYQNFLKLFSC